MRLKNKTAFVTGGAKGIGEAIVKRFIEEGATVFLGDIDDTAGQATAKSLGAHYIHCDVSLEKDWIEAMKTIQSQQKNLHILVNNAGIIGVQDSFGPQDPEHASLASWRKIHEVNSDGVFLGCKHAIAAMKIHGEPCSIVNLSSRSGLVGIPTAAAYASSKASIRNHTKTVALYCAQSGYKIRCNSIHPAAILTPLWDAFLGTGDERKEKIEHLAHDVPLKMIGEPDDVAYLAIYLASEESRYMTGSEIVLDGGILAGSSASPGKK